MIMETLLCFQLFVRYAANLQSFFLYTFQITINYELYNINSTQLISSHM